MTKQQMRLLNDSALSDAARILGFYLSTLPAGPQVMKHKELAVLLHNTPNAATVGRHLRQLEVHGYATVSSEGGKGSPVYEWVDSSPVDKTLAEAALLSNKRQEKPAVVVEDVSNTPLVPPLELKPLAADADALIGAELSLLGECVKPLSSYLRRRVHPDRQEPYVGRVLAALGRECLNPQWRDATGAVIPLARRPAIMADALNELATADEDKGRAHGAGDWNNMRNKLLGLIGAENAPPPQFRATGTGGARASPRSRQPDPMPDDEGATHFQGLNG